VKPVVEQLMDLVGIASVLVRRGGWAAFWNQLRCGLFGGIIGVGGLGAYVCALSVLATSVFFAGVALLAACVFVSWGVGCVLAGSLGTFGLASKHPGITIDDAFWDQRELPERLTPVLFGMLAFLIASTIVSFALVRPFREDPDPTSLELVGPPVAIALALVTFLVVRGVLAFAALSRTHGLSTKRALAEAKALGRGHRVLAAAPLVAFALPVAALSSPGFELFQEIRGFAVSAGVFFGLFVGVYAFGLVAVAAHVIASGESLD
jgi:hypothetical protein